MIVAVTGAELVLTALNPAIFPAPLADNPIVVLLFVQVKVAPGVVLVYVVPATAAPLQTVMLAGTVTTGVGLTVMV